MDELDEPTLFDPEPTRSKADRFAGLGHDARRTARQLEVLASGYNPGTQVPLHPDAALGRDGPGLRCKGCVHLYRTHIGNKDLLKCHQAGEFNSRGGPGPEMRAWWPACKCFEAKPTPASKREYTPPTG